MEAKITEIQTNGIVPIPAGKHRWIDSIGLLSKMCFFSSGRQDLAFLGGLIEIYTTNEMETRCSHFRPGVNLNQIKKTALSFKSAAHLS